MARFPNVSPPKPQLPKRPNCIAASAWPSIGLELHESIALSMAVTGLVKGNDRWGV